MRIKDIYAVHHNLTPNSIVRCRTYRNLARQVSPSPCTSVGPVDDKIIEEECEDDEMCEVEQTDDSNDSLTRQLLESERANGDNWRPEQNEDFTDKEDDDEIEEANINSEQVHNSEIRNNVSINSCLSEPPEIKVTDDDSLLQMAQEYRDNFNGFVEINQFNTIEEMHDFIKNTLESSLLSTTSASTSIKQEEYLDILLNVNPENRFKQLFDTSQVTVRHVLSRNDELLQKLFVSASLENFPSPLAIENDNSIDDDVIYNNSKDTDVNENMKKWYMIEMIGLWLKLITDVTSYRQAIKRHVLKKSWGIENDRYEGIAVPLKYK